MNNRFAVATHALGMLAWLADHEQRGATSEELADCAGTTPVVMRRLLGRLTRAGLVRSRRGVGGGCELAHPASRIDLYDIFKAVRTDDEAALGRPAERAHDPCGVGAHVASYLEGLFVETDAMIGERLSSISLSAMVDAITKAMRAPKTSRKPPRPKARLHR